jgi:hypothetical protein
MRGEYNRLAASDRKRFKDTVRPLPLYRGVHAPSGWRYMLYFGVFCRWNVQDSKAPKHPPSRSLKDFHIPDELVVVVVQPRRGQLDVMCTLCYKGEPLIWFISQRSLSRSVLACVSHKGLCVGLF